MTVEVKNIGAPGLNGLLYSSLLLNSSDLETMHTCLKVSRDIFAGYVDGRIACVWGTVTPTLLSERAGIWLYTTDLIKSHQFVFVRHSQIVINDLLKEYATIEGNTNINSETSKRWIKWLGAEFIYPPEGDRLAFIIRRK